jgi:hypothetical protein
MEDSVSDYVLGWSALELNLRHWTYSIEEEKSKPQGLQPLHF